MKTTQWTDAIYLFKATIDGQDVRGLRCFEADEEAGYIRCYFYPFLLDQDGAPRSYTRYGRVVITPPDPDVLESRAVRFASLVLHLESVK